MRDRRLSRDFWLHEWPQWQRFTPQEVAQLEEITARVLQPLRTAFGVAVVPSSAFYWSDGEPRTGSHAHGAVDFYLERGLTRDAWEWGKTNLMPAGYLGRWIYEPSRSGPGVENPQGEHIHAAPRSAMVAAFGDGRIQALEELEEGNYRLAFQEIPVAWGLLAALGAGAFAIHTLAGKGRRFAF